ncbi:MAG: SagB/ThcOx family dehydrogenase [Bacteroidales bacterium]
MKEVSIKTVYIFLVIFGIVFSTQAQELKTIQLLPPDMGSGKSLMQALSERKSSREFSERELPLQEISSLLWAANGLNRPSEGKHTAPSAKNWQDIDIYVVLKAGVYLYDAVVSQLKPIIDGDFRSFAGTQEFVAKAPVNQVYISDYERIKDAKEENKPTYAASDAAFVAENVYLYCASANLAVVVRASVDKEKLAEVLKLNSTRKIILAQTVGYPK